MQLDMNDQRVSARYKHRLGCAAGGRVGSVLIRVEQQPSQEWRREGSQKAEKAAGDLDAKGYEYCLLSHGRGLRSHWRITAVLFQDHLLKVQNALSVMFIFELYCCYIR